MNANESGYYRKLRYTSKQSRLSLLSVEIVKIIEEHEDNKNYGVRRVITALAQRGITASKSMVYRAMRQLGYLHKRHIPHGITKATSEQQKAENILNRDFKSPKPGIKFLTDITMVEHSEGKLYISPVMDCFDGKIVALVMSNNMRTALCIKTIRQLQNAPKGTKVLFHSDRGSQYTSKEFRDELKKKGFTQSLSGTGHCYDNCRMESFFATLKKEKLYQLPLYKMTRAEVEKVVFRYIFGYYNTKRVNSFNPGGLPPAVYRAEFLKNSAPAGGSAAA